MRKKFLTEKAQRDIRAIRAYTRNNFGAGQAEKYIKELRLKIEQLCVNPNLGVNRNNEFGRNIYSCFSGSHALYYTFNNESIFILSVLHQNQLAENHIF